VLQINNLNRPTVRDFSEQLKLVQSEYSEMPGLHLSKPQAQRLWNLDPRSCDVIFDALEAAHFLRRTRANSYVRANIDY
jgi:diadenosine tetraphosphatase ApaH/serine/threonine PP2A family protein phosphatase